MRRDAVLGERELRLGSRGDPRYHPRRMEPPPGPLIALGAARRIVPLVVIARGGGSVRGRRAPIEPSQGPRARDLPRGPDVNSRHDHGAAVASSAGRSDVVFTGGGWPFSDTDGGLRPARARVRGSRSADRALPLRDDPRSRAEGLARRPRAISGRRRRVAPEDRGAGHEQRRAGLAGGLRPCSASMPPSTSIGTSGPSSSRSRATLAVELVDVGLAAPAGVHGHAEHVVERRRPGRPPPRPGWPG